MGQELGQNIQGGLTSVLYEISHYGFIGAERFFTFLPGHGIALGRLMETIGDKMASLISGALDLHMASHHPEDTNQLGQSKSGMHGRGNGYHVLMGGRANLHCKRGM